MHVFMHAPYLNRVHSASESSSGVGEPTLEFFDKYLQ